MRPNTKENSENKQKCQYNNETIISQAVYQTEDRPKYTLYTYYSSVVVLPTVNLLYPPSERSETGGYTVFTSVCLSVCLCALT